MTTLYESFLKGPETIMTLTSDHDYPKILKDMMKHIHLEGDAVYKGYPFVENGVELKYLQERQMNKVGKTYNNVTQKIMEQAEIIDTFGTYQHPPFPFYFRALW